MVILQPRWDPRLKMASFPAPGSFAKRNVEELRGLATGDREQMWDGPSESAFLLLHSSLGTGLNMVGSWLEKVAGLKTVSDLAVFVLDDRQGTFSQFTRQKSDSLFRSTKFQSMRSKRFKNTNNVRKNVSASRLELLSATCFCHIGQG